MTIEKCPEHPRFVESLNRLEKNTDQIINGLFGPLDQPGTGFIAKVDAALQDLKRSRDTASKAFWVAAGAAIAALVNSVWKVVQL